MRLHDNPIFTPEWEAAELAADGTYRYLIVPMGRNYRLVGIDRYAMPNYDWCFKSYQLALAALIAWNPDTQDEPLFWHKRAGALRQAPHRDHDPDYNSPRCVHGSYLHDRVCDIDPLCNEMPPRQGSHQ